MLIYMARITPLSAFGTPPKGDTLFGQLCWALRNRHGETRLTELLDGYTTGRPFAVVSDAFPAGHLPRPALPGHWFTPLPNEDRKAVKKRNWLPVEHFDTPVADWLAHCRADSDLPGAAATPHPQPHNAIDRRTGTTGKDFAPYTMTQLWYGQGCALDIHIVFDNARLSVAEIEQALCDIGAFGFGRDASIGLGRFDVDSFEPAQLPCQTDADAWLTLAPCAPQGLPWRTEHCFYTVFTRFGRHGDIGVHQGRPFKTPVLLANTGAVLVPQNTTVKGVPFIGQGLGGDGTLSKAIPQTVHQGYAPVVGIELPARTGTDEPGGATP